MEISSTELAGYVGRHISELAGGYSCDGFWPEVDADSLIIIGVLDGSDDLSKHELADYDRAGNKLIRGDHCADCLVRKNDAE